MLNIDHEFSREVEIQEPLSERDSKIVNMPIDRDEWNQGKGRDTKEGRILKFLQENKPKAYSKFEIAEEVFGISQPDKSEGWGKQIIEAVLTGGMTTEMVERPLENLVEKGKVEKKYIETGHDRELQAGVSLESDEYYRAKD